MTIPTPERSSADSNSPLLRGLFITFEGIEGSGKTTQMEHLEAFLAEREERVLTTREPGGSQLGEKIRELLLHAGEVQPISELLLFMADRHQHCQEVIEPTLRKGVTVLCDRFFDSTLAYQGYGRGLSVKLIQRLTAEVAVGLVPDVTFLFDLPVEEGMQRILRRGLSGRSRQVKETAETYLRSQATRKHAQEAVARHRRDRRPSEPADLRDGPDRLEREATEFHERVRQGYLELARKEPHRFVVLDARRSPEQLRREVLVALRKRFKQMGAYAV